MISLLLLVKVTMVLALGTVAYLCSGRFTPGNQARLLRHHARYVRACTVYCALCSGARTGCLPLCRKLGEKRRASKSGALALAQFLIHYRPVRGACAISYRRYLSRLADTAWRCVR